MDKMNSSMRSFKFFNAKIGVLNVQRCKNKDKNENDDKRPMYRGHDDDKVKYDDNNENDMSEI